MQLPRVQFRLWWLMLALAVLAIGTWVFVTSVTSSYVSSRQGPRHVRLPLESWTFPGDPPKVKQPHRLLYFRRLVFAGQKPVSSLSDKPASMNKANPNFDTSR